MNNGPTKPAGRGRGRGRRTAPVDNSSLPVSDQASIKQATVPTSIKQATAPTSINQPDTPPANGGHGRGRSRRKRDSEPAKMNGNLNNIPNVTSASCMAQLSNHAARTDSVRCNGAGTQHNFPHTSQSGGYSQQSNPKNRILGRAKFSAPAMRSLNKAMDSIGTAHHKSNKPLGGQKCFNFSYKEPSPVSSPSKPEPIVMQELGEGKHILDPMLDGQVTYTKSFYTKNQADKMFHMLLGALTFECPNKKGSTPIQQPRLSVWFGPKDLPYSYSYVTLQAHDFSTNRIMSAIKADVEQMYGCSFNSCLVNLYRDNKDGVGWHADDEKSLRYKPTIASLSLGETRRFEFCRKEDRHRRPVYGFHLEHGSGLLMKGDVQENWLHCVPKEYHDRRPRINLTFRTIYPV